MYKYEQYDRAAAQAKESTKALGVCLIVIGGPEGDGVSINPPELCHSLPSLLRAAAEHVEKLESLNLGKQDLDG